MCFSFPSPMPFAEEQSLIPSLNISLPSDAVSHTSRDPTSPSFSQSPYCHNSLTLAKHQHEIHIAQWTCFSPLTSEGDCVSMWWWVYAAS
jgi:hypothetical protein